MKARMFIGTLNNPKETEAYLKLWHTKAKAKYVTGQLERGANGTPHLQYFVHFDTQKRLPSLKKHCRLSNYTPVTFNNGANAYCNKVETRVEGPWTFGVEPAKLNKKGDLARRNKDIIAMGAEKAMEDGHISIKDYARVKSNIDLYTNCTVRPTSLDTLSNEWIYGPPGIGKTKGVTDQYPDYYEKDKSKYWNGYTNQKVVLIDDLEKDETFMLGLLKKIAQHKPFPAEDKFGQMRQIRPEKIIVTSNYHFKTIWSNEVDQQALDRRFKVHHHYKTLITEQIKHKTLTPFNPFKKKQSK